MDSQAVLILSILIGATIRYAVPILYAAIGGLITQKAGVLNFALEGLMLGGAFFAYYAALRTDSVLAGVLGALAVGALSGVVLAVGILRYKTSQLVMGIGLNTFFLGLTGYFFRLLASGDGSVMLENMLGPIRVPVLSQVPLIGIAFEQNLFVYGLVALVAVLAFLLNRTTVGLNLRAVGENPHAAASVGIDVVRTMAVSIVGGSMLAALGGAVMTLTMVSVFIENMVNGRGWIAFTAIILGRYSPGGVALGCLVFGAATAASDFIQIVGIEIPYQASLMVPYLITIVAVSVSMGRGRAPAFLGGKYNRE